MIALRKTASDPLCSGSLSDKQQALIERYCIIEDPQERLAAIVARGRRSAPLASEEKTDENRVPGCVSRVWIAASHEQGRCRFRLEAESPLVQGLAMLWCELYDGALAREIAQLEPELIDAIGLNQLSPTRLNGLASVQRTMRQFAERVLQS